MTKYFNSFFNTDDWESLPTQFVLKVMFDISQITVNKKYVIELLEKIIEELNKHVRNLERE